MILQWIIPIIPKYYAVKKPLEGVNLSRAKELMRTLRMAGFTNQDVSDLTSGAWTEPTIKQYTRGAEVVDSSATFP